MWSLWRAELDKRLWRVHWLLSDTSCSETEIRMQACTSCRTRPSRMKQISFFFFFKSTLSCTLHSVPFSQTEPRDKSSGSRSRGFSIFRGVWGGGALKIMRADKWRWQTPVISIWLIEDGRSGRTRMINRANTKIHTDSWCKRWNRCPRTQGGYAHIP